MSHDPKTSGEQNPGVPLPRPKELRDRRRVRDFLGRVLMKAVEDNIYFMAGAITFNVLVAFIPIFLLVIGIAGFVVSSRFADPAAALTKFVLENLPSTGSEIALIPRVQGLIGAVVEDRAGFSLAGSLVFLWLSTRMVGTLRAVLREVFDLTQDRGVIRGKLFDAQMVVVGGILFSMNLGITIVFRTLREGGHLPGLEQGIVAPLQHAIAGLVAFASIWILFLLVYRFFPPRRIPWRTSLVAATFTAVLFEAAKYLFSWYVTNMANFHSAYGNLTVLLILFGWIYYGAIVFILGGEVAQVYTMRRIRRLHYSGPVVSKNGGGKS